MNKNRAIKMNILHILVLYEYVVSHIAIFKVFFIYLTDLIKLQADNVYGEI